MATSCPSHESVHALTLPPGGRWARRRPASGVAVSLRVGIATSVGGGYVQRGRGVVTFTAEISPVYAVGERRVKERLRGPFPAVVRGVDAGGEAFEAETVLEDISACGLHARLSRDVRPGSPVFLVTVLKRSPEADGCAPRVALRCVVLRSVPRRDGSFGVAVAIFNHRFLDP